VKLQAPQNNKSGTGLRNNGARRASEACASERHRSEQVKYQSEQRRAKHVLSISSSSLQTIFALLVRTCRSKESSGQILKVSIQVRRNTAGRASSTAASAAAQKICCIVVTNKTYEEAFRRFKRRTGGTA
jgi:hypothetical protein